MKQEIIFNIKNNLKSNKISYSDKEVFDNLLVNCDPSLFVAIMEGVKNKEIELKDFKLDYIDLANMIDNLLEKQIDINKKINSKKQLNNKHMDEEYIYYQNKDEEIEIKENLVYGSAVIKSNDFNSNLAKKQVSKNFLKFDDDGNPILLEANKLISAYDNLIISADYELTYLTDEDILYAKTYGIKTNEMKKIKSLYNYLNRKEGE